MQTIGERLEEARKRKGVSLREAAETTKIRGDYLQKLESNKFDLSLSPIYLRGFLRAYALYLKLPADKLVSDFDALGLGEPRTIRPANREVYGRMEFGAGDTASPRAESPAPAAAAEPGHKTSTRAPRPAASSFGTVRPIGADSATNRTMFVQLGALAAGGVLVIVFVIWGVSTLFSSKSKPAVPVATSPVAERTIPPDAPAVRQPVPAQQAILTALGPVRVQVWDAIPNADPAKWKYVKVVQAETALARGESLPVPKTGALIIYASTPENLQIETANQVIKIADQKAALKGGQYITLP